METKICTKCDEERDIENFRWKYKSRGIRDSHCKTCTRAAGKNHYTRNRQVVIQQTRNRCLIYRDVLISWKETLHCVTCKESDRVCLDFHHIDSDSKDGEISKMMHSGMIKKAKQELKKCVVVCKNCHSKIHANHLELTPEHLIESAKLFESLNALVSPLASNQLKE